MDFEDVRGYAFDVAAVLREAASITEDAQKDIERLKREVVKQSGQVSLEPIEVPIARLIPTTVLVLPPSGGRGTAVVKRWVPDTRLEVPDRFKPTVNGNAYDTDYVIGGGKDSLLFRHPLTFVSPDYYLKYEKRALAKRLKYKKERELEVSLRLSAVAAARKRVKESPADLFNYGEEISIERWDRKLLGVTKLSQFRGLTESALSRITANYLESMEKAPPAPSSDAQSLSDIPMYLTKEETKRLRRKLRLEKEQERRKRVLLGLEAEKEPTLRDSTYMLTLRGKFTPTEMEEMLKRQKLERAERHEKHNKRLSKEEAKKKRIRTVKRQIEAHGIHCAAFFFPFRMFGKRSLNSVTSAVSKKMLNGLLLTHKKFTFLVLEGSINSVNSLKNVLASKTRLYTNEPVDSYVVWSGKVDAFHVKKFLRPGRPMRAATVYETLLEHQLGFFWRNICDHYSRWHGGHREVQQDVEDSDQ